MSLKKSDLWIGDRLEDRKTGKIGTLVGLGSENNVQIDFMGTIMLVDLSLLKMAADVSETSKLDLIKDITSLKSNHKIINDFKSEVDLHIEKLRPDLAHANVDRIRDVQVAACKKFIEEAIQHKLGIVKIIHGKGRGVLKNEVLHLVKLSDHYHFHTSANDGGAIEVWFKY